MQFLIVDDHPLILNALAAQLGSDHRCLLATSLQECLSAIEQNPDTDLIIFDPGLPDSHGMPGLMRLRATAPSIPVLVLSGSTDRAEIQNALELGACGFVPKTTAIGVLAQAIDLVRGGGIYIPADMVAPKNSARADATTREHIANALTAREQEILPLLTLGLPDKAIATRLDVSKNTVRVHMAHIRKKLNVTNRAQVVSKFLFGDA